MESGCDDFMSTWAIESIFLAIELSPLQLYVRPYLPYVHRVTIKSIFLSMNLVPYSLNVGSIPHASTSYVYNWECSSYSFCRKGIPILICALRIELFFDHVLFFYDKKMGIASVVFRKKIKISTNLSTSWYSLCTIALFFFLSGSVSLCGKK